MFQEQTSMNERDFLLDYYSNTKTQFESDDSAFYQNFSSVDGLFDDSFLRSSFHLPSKSEFPHPNHFSSQPSNMSSNITNQTQYPQQNLPAIATSAGLQWITTSDTDIRIQSPLDPSSPRTSISSLMSHSSRPSSSTHFLHKHGSFDGSSSDVSISHHKITSSSAVSNFSAEKILGKANPPPKKTKGTPGRKRKFQDHELSPAEAARRNIRRERNKIAAAKCRNRRRDLTNQLQGETDRLEDNQQLLQQEIISLQREKQQLEMLLASHRPNCKAGILDNCDEIVKRDHYRPIETHQHHQQFPFNRVVTNPESKVIHYSNKNLPSQDYLPFQSQQSDAYLGSDTSSFDFIREPGRDSILSDSKGIDSFDFVGLPPPQASSQQCSSNSKTTGISLITPDSNAHGVYGDYTQRNFQDESSLSSNRISNSYFSPLKSLHSNHCPITTVNSTKEQICSYSFSNQNEGQRLSNPMSPSKRLVAL